MSVQSFHFMINGFAVEAQYSSESIETIWKPLLNRWKMMQETKQGRLLVYLVAPPAVGKSTLAYFLAFLAKQLPAMPTVQSIGLDGFHFSQAYIHANVVRRQGKIVPMKDVKGCPETFDIDAISEAIKSLRYEDIMWPIYDRKLHDVVANQIHVTADIVLIEGNWLLLKDEKWCALKRFCDDSVFIDAPEGYLKSRLVKRKVMGGLSLREAERFYEQSDAKNVKRVKEHSQVANVELLLSATGEFHYKKGKCENDE